MQCYYASKQYRRALALLRKEQLPDGALHFKSLIAQCLAACKEWDELLALLGDGEGEELAPRHVGAGVGCSAAVAEEGACGAWHAAPPPGGRRVPCGRGRKASL